MAMVGFSRAIIFSLFILGITRKCNAEDIIGCGGFVKSHVSLDFSKIEIGLYTKEGGLKEKTECAPTNGYYFLPLYEKGEYVLKVHPPAGWSFEPSHVNLNVNGATDPCSAGQDINFAFNGFGITGKVITAGQKQGPSGISVDLVNDKSETRNTITTIGGDFHFTPVIPGKYTVRASHPRWKLDPSQAVVQVKEGNTALPFGVLVVKGFDVTGSVSSFGSPIGGIYVLLYSKEENPKFRVEGCNTALMQGVPDSPICHSITDASGEFAFGLVPAGDYKLLALPTPPGQVTVTYNIKPDSVPFTVKHDSLFIKNAFEVIGFTVVGSVVASIGGNGISGARVLLDGKPLGNTDATGKFTLPNLQPGVYTLGVQHEQCEFDESRVTVTATGPAQAPAVRAARWRVCGAVTPPDPREVTLASDAGPVTIRRLAPDDAGKWCTYLPSGVYTAKIEVTEQEQREGLQFYPVTQKVSVGHSPVSGVVFSQLKGRLSGTLVCDPASACSGVRVTLRPLSLDGGYIGQSLTTEAKDGTYEFSEVLPGSVEVSVPAERLCWAEARHNVPVTQEHTAVPAFHHTGYVLLLHATHAVQVEYSSKRSKGVLAMPRGRSRHCVRYAEPHTLTPTGCHRFRPAQAQADTSAPEPTVIHFAAVAHAVGIRVTSPEPVTDLLLRISSDDHGVEEVGPLVPVQSPTGGYLFEHTLYMAEGEVSVVSAHSATLLFHPSAPQQVLGEGDCRPQALTVCATRGLTLSGRLLPPQSDVTVTLTSLDTKLTQVTGEDGTYKFGPLDASREYSIRAEKESYVFSEPDENGDILVHKLAEINVQLVEDADDSPLQGGLVSVSGGSYRRTLGSGPEGRLRFASLSPAQYYVRPNMKEYRFTPPHALLPLEEGSTHNITLRGVRVAWSCVGTLVSLGGVGWEGAVLLATPTAGVGHAQHCATEEATTELDGTFRIRGLLPECSYTIHLKESNTVELRGLKLAKAPALLEVKERKDLRGVKLIAVQPPNAGAGAGPGDTTVHVRCATLDHYRTLRLTLASEHAPHHPLYSTRLDPAGYSQNRNPGLMYVLPRLPADNKTYVLQLDSTLSKASHIYDEEIHYFNSDGQYRHFSIQFNPKVKSSEQELRQTSLLMVPVLVAFVFLCRQRARLGPGVAALLSAARARVRALRASRGPRPARQDLLDRASIDHILTAVNTPAKKPTKKKL